MGNLVNYQTDRGVAVLTLNDPPVNAYTHEMLVELDAHITDARFDDDVQVVVVTGHGEHFFSAGANIKMLREVDASFRYNFFLYASETMSRIEHTPKLVIAALNGHAVGGGFEVAMACDLRIARGGAGSVGLPQIDLGLIPGSGGTQRLARFIGKGRAMQMLLEGEKLLFEDALALGLIDHVWNTATHAEFVERVLEHARRYTLPHKASNAVGKLKRALQAAYDLPLDQGVTLEQELEAQLCGSDDACEGLQAWLDKRRPAFQGK